jgi:hypothetical protein
MPRTRIHTLRCDRCDAEISVEVTAPQRQLTKRLHQAMLDKVVAEGWAWLKFGALCPKHMERK